MLSANQHAEIFACTLHVGVLFVYLGTVHTIPFSNENGAVLLRLQKDLRPHLSFSPVRTTTPIKREATW